jgi:mono/diheme cytochrome c family protein
MSRLAAPIATALLAAGVLAACGGGGDDSSTTASPTTAATTQETTTTATSTATTETATTDTQSTTESASAAGKEVFTQNCGSCHTLSDAGTSGQVGPNLDDLKPSESKVVSQVNAGGGAMPSFKGTLSEAQIKAVASYVSGAAGN